MPKLTEKEWSDFKNDMANSEALLNKPMDELKESYRKEIIRYKEYLRGIFRKSDLEVDDPVITNEFWVNNQIQKPNLFFRRPHITVTPDYSDLSMEEIYEENYVDEAGNEQKREASRDRDFSKIENASEKLEYVLNHYSRKLDDEVIFERIIDDALLCYGVHKGGWEAILEDGDVKYQSLDPNWRSERGGDGKKFQENTENATQRILDEKRRQQEEIEGEQVNIPRMKVDSLISERVSWADLIIDPECTDIDLKTARYTGFKYLVPNDWCNHYFNKKFEPTSEAIWADSSKMEEDFNNLKRNLVYEVWNMQTKKVIYYVKGYEDEPAKISDWIGPKNVYPATILAFNEDNDRFLPIPDFRHIKRQVFEKIKLRTRMAKLLKIMHQVWLADGSIASKLEDLLKSSDGGVVPVKNTQGKPLQAFIQAVADFQLSGSLFDYGKIVDSDIERISGIPDYQRGLVSEVKRTATEMIQLSGSQNLRIDTKREKIARFIVKVNQKRIRLLQDNAVIQRVIRVIKDGKPEAIEWDREEVLGEFNINMDVGSMLKKNVEVQRKQTLEKFDKLQNHPLENQEMLLKDVHDSYDDRDIEKRVMPPKSPAPKEPDPPRINVSIKAELTDPNALMLLKQYGAKLEALGTQEVIPGGEEISGEEAFPLTQPQPESAETMQQGIQNEAVKI